MRSTVTETPKGKRNSGSRQGGSPDSNDRVQTNSNTARMLKNLLLLTLLQLAICLGANAQSTPSNNDAWAELVAADGSGDDLLWVLASLSGSLPSDLYLRRLELKAQQLRIWGEVEGGVNLAAFATNLQSLNWVESTEIAAPGAAPLPPQDFAPDRSKFDVIVQIKSPRRSLTIEPVESVLAELPRALVAMDEIDPITTDLFHAALGNGMRADLFLAQTVEQRQHSVVRPYLLKLVGQFGGAIGFLDQISKLPRLVAIACSNWEAVGSEIKVDCRAEIHMRHPGSQSVGGRSIRKRAASARSTIEAAKAGSSNPFDSARIVALCPRTGFDSSALNTDSTKAAESIRVLAIFDGFGGRRQALVMDIPPTLRSLKVGDALGHSRGRITAIAHDEVVVAEPCRGLDGLILDRKIRYPVKN